MQKKSIKICQSFFAWKKWEMSATVDFFVSTKAGDLKTRLLKRLKVVKFDVNFVTFSISSPTIFRFSLKAMTVRH